MKNKRVKGIVSMMMTLIVLLSVCGQNSILASANTSYSQYGDDMLRYAGTSYDDLLIYRKNYGYMNLVEDIRTNSLALYLFEMADIFAETDSEPDKEKYMEVLINIIATYDLDNAADISKQNSMDNLKDAKDYMMDFVKMGTKIISIKTGIDPTSSKLETVISTAIDAVAMLAEDTNNWIDAISNLETILQNYAKYDAFLKVIEDKGQGELKEAASTLRNSMSEVMEIKLNTYTEISNENFGKFEEFFFDDMFFSVLKQTSEYETDEGIKFFVDTGDEIASNRETLVSSWDLGTMIGKMIGNITVGGENIINRVMEMMALYDISVILQGEVLELGNEFLKVYGTEEEEKAVREYVLYSQYLIGCRIRGEYCVYSIAVKDAGLLSWFGKETAKDAAKWYQDKSGNILMIQDNLPKINITQESVAVSVDWEMCYTDIEENGITRQYAIITGLNEQDDILWRYETNKYEAAELDSVSAIGNFNEKYYFVENGSIIALNLLDGSILWRNNEFGGAGIAFDFGENGELYICGYYGPDFFVADKEGNTMVKIDSFDSQYYCPYKVEYLGETVRVSMGGAIDYNKVAEVEVNLKDYSFNILEIIGSGADGEYVDAGVLDLDAAGVLGVWDSYDGETRLIFESTESDFTVTNEGAEFANGTVQIIKFATGEKDFADYIFDGDSIILVHDLEKYRYAFSYENDTMLIHEDHFYKLDNALVNQLIGIWGNDELEIEFRDVDDVIFRDKTGYRSNSRGIYAVLSESSIWTILDYSEAGVLDYSVNGNELNLNGTILYRDGVDTSYNTIKELQDKLVGTWLYEGITEEYYVFKDDGYYEYYTTEATYKFGIVSQEGPYEIISADEIRVYEDYSRLAHTVKKINSEGQLISGSDNVFIKTK